MHLIMTTSVSLIYNLLVIIGLLLTLSILVDARAFFVFGDSFVNSGNNNYLVIIACVDSAPYGIVFDL